MVKDFMEGMSRSLTSQPTSQKVVEARSRKDIEGLRKKFSFLKDFSDDFIATTPLDAILKTETTALKIIEIERNKKAGTRLAQNRDELSTTFTNISAGQDNRWDSLHEARFLPGAGCPAAKLWLRAREVLGPSGHVPIGTYDMASIGLGGFVSKRGWVELHDVGSESLSLKLFNINSCGNKITSKSRDREEEEYQDINELGEFKLALRVAREAMAWVHPWNKSVAALEGFFHQTDFCKEDLLSSDKSGQVLTQFSDYVFGENADRWRGMQVFLSTGELRATWASFWGARPESKLKPKKKEERYAKGDYRKKSSFIWDPSFFDDICRLFNMGKCTKAPGTCTTRSGIPLRHICNYRADKTKPQDVCGKSHQAIHNH